MRNALTVFFFRLRGFMRRSLGLLAPFLISAFLKTAQGSSTVAAITAAAIVQPLLPTLHLATPEQKTFCVLAIGAGSITVSHANDAYFWLVEKLPGPGTRRRC